MNFEEKNVIITGGTGGIGNGIASKLLKLGVKNIGIFDIFDKTDTVTALKNEFPNRSIVFYQCDIQNRCELNLAYQKFVTEFKFIDIVVNSAGILNENPKFHKDVILINLLGIINSTYEAINFMSIEENKGRGGTIINISSISGLLYSKTFPVYTASKHGIIGFTKSISHETNSKRHGINFIVICPGITDTPFTKNLSNKIASTKISVEQVAQRISTLKTPKQSVEQFTDYFAEILENNKNGLIAVVDGGIYQEFVQKIYSNKE